MAWLLGIAWGVLAAWPLVQRARRDTVRARAASLHGRSVESVGAPMHIRSGVVRAIARGAQAAQGDVTRAARALAEPALRLARPFLARRREHASDAALGRELPVVIDVLGVAIGAGCTPYLAVRVVAEWGPPLASAHCQEVMRSCALGIGFEQSLDAVARSTPRLGPLTEALLASDRLGAPVGSQLARLAEEERAALRRHAEAHARRVPVKLLFPLVFLVLPAFVLLTVVPGLMAGLRRL